MESAAADLRNGGGRTCPSTRQGGRGTCPQRPHLLRQWAPVRHRGRGPRTVSARTCRLQEPRPADTPCAWFRGRLLRRRSGARGVGTGGGVQTVPPAPRPPGPAAASRAGRTWRTCRRSPRSGRLASRRAPAHAQCLQLAEKDKTGEQDKEQKKNADSRNAERKGFFGLRQQITKPRSHLNPLAATFWG